MDKFLYFNKRKKNTLIICFLCLSVILYVYLTIVHAQVKVIHIDSLHFSSIFQEEYEQTKSITEVPGAFLRGIEKCNDYDLGRGRITNYVAFGIESFTRNCFPLPFISWLTMFIVLLNSILLAFVITKPVRDLTRRIILFSLVMMLIVLNPLFLYSYQLQFIYPKYLCVTFVLLFLVSKKLPFRLFFLLCAMFSDEIGLVATMLVVFIMVVQYFLIGRNRIVGLVTIGKDFNKLLKTFSCGLITSLSVLFLYFLVIIIFFGTLGLLGGLAGSSVRRSMDISVINESIKYLFKIINSVLGGNFIVTIISLSIFICVLFLCVKHVLFRCLKSRKIEFSLYSIYYFAAGFLLLFIVFVIYGGTTSFSYYGYPAAILFSFLIFSLLVKKLSYKYSFGFLLIICFFSIIKVPVTINSMPSFPDLLKGIRSPAISQIDFDNVELAIMQLKQQDNIQVFNIINNKQELNFSGGYLYTKNYFPISGMVRVLIWPKQLPGEQTKYKQMYINKIDNWEQFQELITKKLFKTDK